MPQKKRAPFFSTKDLLTSDDESEVYLLKSYRTMGTTVAFFAVVRWWVDGTPPHDWWAGVGVCPAEEPLELAVQTKMRPWGQKLIQKEARELFPEAAGVPYRD